MSGFTLDAVMQASKLGGGLPGAQPRGGLLGGGANSNSGTGMVGGQARGLNRIILRQAFGNNALHGLPGNPSPLVATIPGASLTPFRRATNAGDLFNTVNQSTRRALGHAPNQVNNIRRASLFGYKTHAGGVKTDGNSAYSGNPKYVYDGSDYTRFKKLQAENRTYNDLSFGGANNGAYVPLMHVRH